jgi:hypothetical protein
MRLLLLFLTLTLATHSCFAKPRKLVTFANSYRGLRIGQSTLKDANSIFGRYVSVKSTPNGRNYRFPQVIVNISDPDRVRISTVTIDKDYKYTTAAGVKLGQTVALARKRLPVRKEGKGWLYDDRKGIFYWHDGKRVNRIILVHQAYTW